MGSRGWPTHPSMLVMQVEPFCSSSAGGKWGSMPNQDPRGDFLSLKPQPTTCPPLPAPTASGHLLCLWRSAAVLPSTALAFCPTATPRPDKTPRGNWVHSKTSKQYHSLFITFNPTQIAQAQPAFRAPWWSPTPRAVFSLASGRLNTLFLLSILLRTTPVKAADCCAYCASEVQVLELKQWLL